MPNRIIKAGLVESSRVNSVRPLAELLYVHLLLRVDDFGRFYADPALVRNLCFPGRGGISAKRVAQLLDECEAAGLIERYAHEDTPHLRINRWVCRHRATTSKFPPAPSECQADDGQVTDKCPSDAPVVVVVGAVEDEGAVEDGKPPRQSKKELPGFKKWWKTCPPNGRARADKKKCEKFWQANNCEAEAEAIVDYMERCCKSKKWREDGGQYVPGAGRWLRDEKWKDETYMQDIGGPTRAQTERRVRQADQKRQADDDHNAKLREIDALWNAASQADKDSAIAEVARSPMAKSSVSPQTKLGWAKAALARRKHQKGTPDAD